MEDNNYTCSKSRYLFRVCTAFASILAPFILLIKGIYGSFIFSFSIPLLWQVVYLGKSPSSLGLKKESLARAIISGVVSGAILAFLGGKVLQLLGLTGYSLTNAHNIQFVIGTFKIKFSLARELGYRLLMMSNSFKGFILYLLFLILVIGLGEEIFWRGFIQRKIAHRVTKSAAIWITAVLFALTHSYVFIIVPISKGLILLVLIGILGAIWGCLYEKTDNIWSAAISHGIVASFIWKYYFFG